MRATPLRPTLETLALIGRSDVGLPLSRTLFPEEILRSAADQFPDAVRLARGQLVLSASRDAHGTLRDVLRYIYQARP